MKNIFNRSSLNPILPPTSEWWKVYNPGAVLDEQGIIHLYPRVVKKEEDWHSRIAHATSTDGEHFTWDSNLILERENSFEKRGLEDPRVVEIDSTYYMAYAAYDGKHVQLHTAIATNPYGPWQRQGEALPGFNFFAHGAKMVKWEHGKPVEKTVTKRGEYWSKSGTYFPQKINDEYVMLFGEYYMWLATSQDGITFHSDEKPFITPRKGTKYFDNTFIETGPQPILTEKGWLVLYHGIDEAFRYQLGFMILDKDNPRNILYRSDESIFGPQEDYEVGDALIDVIPGGVDAMSTMDDNELKSFYKKARDENIMPQVTFCPGIIVQDGIVRIYYGAGDTSICTAWARLEDILKLVA
ncbi:MAG: hypothetical protein V4519_01150 [Patescibacteria group bacterium]